MCHPPSFEVSGNVWLWRVTKTRAERCRWPGRRTERKPRLVTQLDEVAECGLIGCAACVVRFVCGVYYYMLHKQHSLVFLGQNEDTVAYVLLHFSKA